MFRSLVAAALLIAISAPAASEVLSPARQSDYDRRLREAMSATVRGDLDQARRDFEALNHLFPLTVGPFLGLAEVSARQGDPAAAEARLRAGLLVAPRSAELYRALGRLVILRDRREEGVTAFDTAIRLAPEDVSTYVEIGDLLNERLGLSARALPYYQAALARDGSNPGARLGLGLALARQNRLGDALVELTDAARLAPTDPVPEYSRAQVLIRLNRPVQALEAYDTALARAPRFIQAQIARGSLLLSLGRPADAIRTFEAALAIDPRALGALLGLAMAQEAAGQREAATARYREVLATDPDNVVALNNLAWMFTEHGGNLDEALGLARRAAELAPRDPAVRGTLGWVLRQRGALPEAAAELQHAVTLQPNAPTLTRLGLVRVALGQDNAADAVFREALRLDPGYAPAREQLARRR